MKEKGTLAILAMMIAISALAMCANLTRGHDWGGDFAAYIMQAKSITEGSPRAFVDANRFTINQSSRPVGPIAYPWGYPLLLAPVYALFGLNLLALKSLGVISYLLFLIVLWFAFRKDHSASWLLCLVCIFALNPTLVTFSNNILADLTFILMSTLCMWIIRDVVVEDRTFISRRSDVILIGGLIISAFLVRTNGVILLVVLGLTHLLSLRRKHIDKATDHSYHDDDTIASHNKTSSDEPITLFRMRLIQYIGLLVLFSFVGWLLYDAARYYLPHLDGMSKDLIVRHMLYYIDLPSDFFHGAPKPHLIYGATIPLALAGALKRYRSDYPYLIYIVLTITAYIFVPATQGLRYIFPILPFYISFAITGMESFADSASAGKPSLRKAVCYVPIIIVGLFFGWNSLGSEYRSSRINSEMSDGPFAATSQQMFTFVRSHTGSDSVIIFFKPRVMRLMTDRQSLTIDRTEELSRGNYLCLFLRRGAHLQVSQDEVERLSAEGVARMIYANDDFRVYRLEY